VSKKLNLQFILLYFRYM